MNAPLVHFLLWTLSVQGKRDKVEAGWNLCCGCGQLWRRGRPDCSPNYRPGFGHQGQHESPARGAGYVHWEGIQVSCFSWMLECVGWNLYTRVYHRDILFKQMKPAYPRSIANMFLNQTQILYTSTQTALGGLYEIFGLFKKSLYNKSFQQNFEFKKSIQWLKSCDFFILSIKKMS